MKIIETTYTFLEQDCIKVFGAGKGAKIYQEAENIYQTLVADADYMGNDMIKDHLQLKLYPLMAFYKTLLLNDISKEDALKFARDESIKVALNKKDENKSLAKMPFAYSIYRMGAKSHMNNNFPVEGWETEWVKNDKREIHFNLNRCIYWDLTNKHECPELCCVYCENDIITFSGLLPKIRFERNGTLANGSNCCDFHFINTKRSDKYTK